MTIREIIQQIVRETIDREFGIPCTVTKINDFTIDCSPIDGKADYLDVKLQTEQASGVLIIPKVGSIVMVEQVSSDTAYVSMVGEVDEVIFLDGNNGGMVKVSELVDKLNTLEERMFTHQHISAAPASITTVDPASNPIIPQTQVAELANDKIKH